MRSMLTHVSAAAIVLLCAGYSQGASLRVAPTNLELIAPDSAAVLNLRNDAKRPINVQVRVFRWRQAGGVEQLEPTSDVVASPPSTRIGPNADYVVRVVRVSKAPVDTEESYRVLVDELPDPSRRKGGTVTLVLRYSVPVFFRNPDAKASDVSFSVSRTGGRLMLIAHNNGESRVRLSNLNLVQGGKKLGGRSGLVGYVLGGATMQWPLGNGKSLAGSPITLKGQSDRGPFDAPVAIKGR
ncbi:molecular chaperone [Mesorhizobium sp. M0622]|uniref:fimbrial biogenesis chaperone n=1 Tax=unclassified Mesorhizobium TaxID=325217 RepID=UPI0033397C9E